MQGSCLKQKMFGSLVVLVTKQSWCGRIVDKEERVLKDSQGNGGTFTFTLPLQQWRHLLMNESQPAFTSKSSMRFLFDQ
jgi:hypothetical protein